MAIRAKHATAPTADKPQCKIHDIEMMFDATEMRWRCTHEDCPMVAYPKQDDSGRPQMGKGPIEFVVFKDEDGLDHLYLRSSTNNLMIEVTEYSPVWSTDGNTASVALEFDRVTQVDNYSKSKSKRSKK